MESLNSLNDKKDRSVGMSPNMGTPYGGEQANAKMRELYISILAEADKAVNGSRNENYGKQRDNFQRIAEMWRVILGVPVTSQQVAMCMVALKLARLVHTNGHHRDSIVDIAGYAECLAKINEGY